MFLKNKFISLCIHIFIITLFFSCNKEETGGDVQVWYNPLESNIISGELFQFELGWQISWPSGYYDFKVDISGPNNYEQVLVQTNKYITQGEKEGTVMFWEASMNTPARGKRPLVSGLYGLHLQLGQYSASTNLSVERNTYDYDSDNISDAIENENDEDEGTYDPVNMIYFDNDQAYYYNRSSANSPPMIPLTIQSTSEFYVNRQTHDYSLAHGTYGGTLNTDDGWLDNGIRIANQGTGYYDKNWNLTTPNPNYIHDQHNWGTLELINLIERVARKWYNHYPDGPRIGVGDLSLEYGGETDDHSNHENGLEVDIRYVRATISSNNTLEDVLNVRYEHNGYDQAKTTELIGYILENSIITRIYVDPDTHITDATYTNSNHRIKIDDDDRVHDNHFHVQIADPDGSGN